MSVPNYTSINGEALTNGNRHYKVYNGPDSAGNPGKWHVYYDGEKVFLADPPPSWGGNEPNSMASGGAAAAAAPPDPAPTPDTSATVPPVTPGTAVRKPAASSSSPQGQPDSGIWITNNTPGSKHEGDRYRVDPGHDSEGHAGTWHTYEDGSKEFMISPNADLPNDHNTAVMGSLSSTGVNNADGLHGVSGFSGQASELHGSTQSAALEVASPAPATMADGANSSFDGTPPTAVGQPTDLPGGGVTTNGSTYTVVEGDNMWAIAQAHNMSLEQLTALNPQITNPELILPGQQINTGILNSVSTDGADASFPTTSNYDGTSPVVAQADTRDSHNIDGWSDGTDGVPSDPTHGIASVAQVQTDPLKINDDKQNT